MSETSVKAHVRSGRFVRSHRRRITVRLLNRKNPSSVDLKIMRDLLEHGYGARSTNALAVGNGEIVLIHPIDVGPKDLPVLLSHETLHHALNRVGEKGASVYLDSRRGTSTWRLERPLRERMERTGLYRYRPKRRA